MREETEAIREHYNDNPQKEWDRLKKFHLGAAKENMIERGQGMHQEKVDVWEES